MRVVSEQELGQTLAPARAADPDARDELHESSAPQRPDTPSIVAEL
jgi:hypothetical protein